MSDDDKKRDKDNSGSYVGGTILIGLGVIFLLINLRVIPNWGDSWPIILIVVGLGIIIGGLGKKKKSDI